MPKQKENQRAFIARMVKENKEELRSDGIILFCKSCEKTIKASRAFHVSQHFSTAKHQKQSKARVMAAPQQAFLTECIDRTPHPFGRDLCQMFLKSNIPLKKISNPHLVQFLEKYTDQKIPCESTLRQKYVPLLYGECMETMRKKAHNKDVWISVETTDGEQRLIANFIFGVLGGEEEKDKSYLLNVSELDAANASSIAAFVNDSLTLLWPEGVKYDCVLIAITDAAPYMVAAMRSLKTLFPNMLHITCFAHGLHRVCEFIRSEFQEVNLLISSVKSIFVKAPSRRKKFKSIYPELALPPTPSTIRWGTWLKAAEYYSDNFSEIKALVETLREEESEAIRVAKNLLTSDTIFNDLVFIKSNFAIIHRSITTLETKGLSLKSSLKQVKSVRKSLQQLSNKVFFNKFEAVFGRNVGFEDIKIIEKLLFQNKTLSSEYVKRLTPSKLILFKYCPVTSCDVERSFSAYSLVLTEKRRKFTMENLKQHMIVYCNNQSDRQEDT